MSAGDYEKELEAAYAALEAANSPLLRPLSSWSIEEAEMIARQRFEAAPSDHKHRRLISEARDAIRAAKTPRRLEGIRKRRPDLAEIIDEAFDWLAYHTVDWDRLPFDVKVRDWIEISAMSEQSEGIASTRGTDATWPGVREAAFVLIDWHDAVEGKPPSIGWLSKKLSEIEPGLDAPTKSGANRAKKLARQMLTDRQSGQFRR